MMEISKRILFIVNGLGMGNSTRCHSIIEKLNEGGYSVDLVTSGNGMDYFKKNKSCINDLMEIRSLLYKKYKGKLSIIRTMLSLPMLVVFYTHNVYIVYNILKKKVYHAVVVDSDYTMLLLRIVFKNPVFAINNADIVVEEVRKLRKRPRNIFMQYMVEKIDYWFHRLCVDFVLSPTIMESRNNYSDTVNNIYHFPPFIRSGLIVSETKKIPANILIMLSGSQFATDISFIENKPDFINIPITVLGRRGSSNELVQYLGKVYNNKNHLNKADILIINAGFSAISEAVLLRKPCVVLPIDNHAEQYINAHLMGEKGYAVIAGINNVWEKTNELITNYNKFRQSLDNNALPMNGALLASEMIAAKILSLRGKRR